MPEGARGRKVEDPARYNAAAARVMKERSIEAVDLNAHSRLRPDLQRRADVHFTDAGSRHLAEAVAAGIRARIGR